MARPQLHFDFVARYEVELFDRIPRNLDFDRVLGFSNAVALDPQQELAVGPIVGVRPATGPSWVGVFHGGAYGHPLTAPTQVIGWPDERSLCVIHRGAGCVVRTDEPELTFEIAALHSEVGGDVAHALGEPSASHSRTRWSFPRIISSSSPTSRTSSPMGRPASPGTRAAWCWTT